MDNITASELAGFGVGTLLLCFTIAAPKVDGLISASQRTSLGMCKRCGDMKVTACSRCKGAGFIKSGGVNLNPFDALLKPRGGDKGREKSISCSTCRSTGRMSCTECSRQI